MNCWRATILIESEDVVAGSAVRLLACAGMVAAGMLIGGGIASADSGLGGLGIGREQNNDSKPTSETDQTPVNLPVVRIGAREDRGGFEVGPGGIRISRQPGFRGGFDTSSGGSRLTIDERGISGAFNLGPSGSRVTFGLGPGGLAAGRDQGAQAGAELGPSGTRVGAEVAASGQGSTDELGANEGSAKAPDVDRAAMAQRLTIFIPVPRLLAGTGGRAQSLFTTVVISVPTGSILRGYGQPQPRPAPTPSPSFRTSELPTEVPDVEAIDSSGQRGSDYAPADLQPVRAPLVIAPPPVAPLRPVAPPAVPPVAVAPPPAGGRPGSQLHVPSSIVAGAPPGVRGPAPESVPPPAAGAGPVEMPPTRLGYQQYLRTARVTDIAVVAVPGVVGLVLMTVSGALIGYRQARAGHMLRHTGATRFMA
jgi:hypothetical protein